MPCSGGGCVMLRRSAAATAARGGRRPSAAATIGRGCAAWPRRRQVCARNNHGGRRALPLNCLPVTVWYYAPLHHDCVHASSRSVLPARGSPRLLRRRLLYDDHVVPAPNVRSCSATRGGTCSAAFLQVHGLPVASCAPSFQSPTASELMHMQPTQRHGPRCRLPRPSHLHTPHPAPLPTHIPTYRAPQRSPATSTPPCGAPSRTAASPSQRASCA